MSTLKERLILAAPHFTGGQAPLADIFNECASVIQLAEALATRTLAYIEPLNGELECDVEMHELASGLLAKIAAEPALAGEAATAAKTPQSGLVHEHATAQPERPMLSPTPILPKKERPL